ncbi:MAG: ArdC family protein [Thiomonas sp.]
MNVPVDALNPDLRLGVQAYAFLAADKGLGTYTFPQFADIIGERYDSANARVITEAFRALPDGSITVGDNGAVSVDLPDAIVKQQAASEPSQAVPDHAASSPAIASTPTAGAIERIEPGQAGSTASRDFRQEFTDKVVAAIESGQALPWNKPWHTLQGLPRNAVSGKNYQGGNRVILGLVAMEKGYGDPRWMTVKQSNDLGGHVRKGEKGVMIERWDSKPFWQRRDVELVHQGRIVGVDRKRGVDEAGVHLVGGAVVPPASVTVQHDGKDYSWKQAERALDLLVGRNYVVFNAEQCDKLKLEPLVTRQNIPVLERGEQLMTAMQEDGVRFVHQGARAYYAPAGDLIALPPRDTFQSVEGYYGTALHEMGHATGAEKRLNRDGITGGHSFGSEGYAREELRAELFSAFMAAETGIPHDDDQHMAYLQSWAQALKQDKNEMFRAASEAGKAVDYVLGQEQDLLQKINRLYGQLVGPEVADLSKEPHAVTFAEFSGIAHAEKLGPSHGRQWEVFMGKESLGFADGPTIDGALRQVHAREVNNALYGNQPDSPEFLRKSMPPPRVLAEYPGLQKLWAGVIEVHRPAQGQAALDAAMAKFQSEVRRAHAVDPPAAQEPAPPQKSRFWRKASNVEDICDDVVNLPGAGAQGSDAAKVADTKALSAAEYDAFTSDFFKSQSWLAGKGGVERMDDGSDQRHVVEVTAPDRQTLHIDPSGHDYARYVGIPEADVERVRAARSLLVSAAPAKKPDLSNIPQTERYELFDAHSESLYAGPSAETMIGVAEKLGSTQFQAVAADGQRTDVVRGEDGTWKASALSATELRQQRQAAMKQERVPRVGASKAQGVER